MTATQILQARLHRLEGFQRKKLVATGPIHASSNAMANGRLFELTAEAGALTVAFVAALPRSLVFYELGGQLLASGTSTEANYRAAQRARSPAEFVPKLKIVEEEADECLVWIDRLRSARLPTTQASDAERLRDMFNQIVALTVQSIKTTRSRHLGARGSRRRRG